MLDFSIGLHLMSSKGVAVLAELLDSPHRGAIRHVVTSRDPAVERDYRDEIAALARAAGIPVHERGEVPRALAPPTLSIAVSWRWLIPVVAGTELVVFHDSLLPRYRGFAPLVSALVNGDRRLGVTALLAADDYDVGPVVAQEAVDVTYPLRIADAIDAIAPCYRKLARRVCDLAAGRRCPATPQDESLATYSLWRDDEDYLIDWAGDAARIRRFVDAVGHPYRGALAYVGKSPCRVVSCSEMPDVEVENRAPGKVIFLRKDEPVVVCGSGLLQIHELRSAETGDSALPLARFRTRFTSAPR